MGSIAISVPSEKSVSPKIRIVIPKTINIRVPIGIGTTVRCSSKMMAPIGSAACSDSFNFSIRTVFILDFLSRQSFVAVHFILFKLRGAEPVDEKDEDNEDEDEDEDEERVKNKMKKE
jgi:hypothetical protein